MSVFSFKTLFIDENDSFFHFFANLNSLRMTVFEEAVNGYAELSKEFKGKSPNLDRCGQILGKLKIALTQLSFLPNDEAPSNKVIKKIR